MNWIVGLCAAAGLVGLIATGREEFWFAPFVVAFGVAWLVDAIRAHVSREVERQMVLAKRRAEAAEASSDDRYLAEER